MRDVRRALADDDPLALLALVSSILTTVDDRRIDAFDADDRPEGLTLDALVTSFGSVDRRETSALLTALAAITPDDLLRVRVRRILEARRHALPVWLTGLQDARAYGTVEMVHVLGDGDNIMIGLRLVGGAELTFVVYVDHNVGTLVKDAFVVPEAVEKLIRFMKSKSDDVDTEWRPLDPAEARARITEAIAMAAMTYPPFESETWPMCRPLVEWANRKLPEGGTGYTYREWSDVDLAVVADRFFASPFGADLDGDDGRELVEHLLWFAVEGGPGDPLRWSPVAVELVLVDWIPRTTTVPSENLARLPDVLRAFVRFCHDERGIRPSLTAETLDAVDQWEPEYHAILADLRSELGAFDPVEWARIVRSGLARQVGGEEVLDALDLEPLPDEEFQWDGVPDDIRPVVADVLERTDGWCDAVGDVECRTACRRFLARAADRSPSLFRGDARADTTAAAVCWAVGKANDVFDRKLLVKDLLTHFGLRRSVSPRAYTMIRAGGFDPDAAHSYDVNLGSSAYLTSRRRRWIVETREALDTL
ncbi:MAG: hypothetical protein QOJ69_1129 [Actinomycetota bacterium]|nr:hypothetical protein [Actinomycetota bacterium]